jgi:hypothetical protein
MLPQFFDFNLSPSRGIATSTALHAIRRFLRQYCSRSSDPDKVTFFLHLQNFSSVFRKILKGKDYFPPIVSALKGVLHSFLQYAKGD